MTVDEAVALSLLPDLPRVGLTDRLRADDPELMYRARTLCGDARAAMQRARADGIRVIAWHDPLFPSGLLAIGDAPPALWYRGCLDAFAAPAVAVVGSRAASAVAREMAEQLGADLASRGVVVVSGLARGVDSAAHRGALTTGRTIAVLGSGVDRIYPREHARLADDIAKTGLVVSEYPPGTPPLAFHFPMRNRLISGLARAVVVIEASEQSGSLITASCALEQGREVMAVPGNVLSGRSRGAHALIRDGAKIVESADDIVEELGWVTPSGGAGADHTKSSHAARDPLVERMQVGQAYDLDELSGQTGINGVRLLPRLLELELNGLIRRIDGGRFMRSI